jgi:23S rRNA (guanosine2251-2'-O)-methyltransferase
VQMQYANRAPISVHLPQREVKCEEHFVIDLLRVRIAPVGLRRRRSGLNSVDDTIAATMEHVEGRIPVLAALEARQRKIDVILLRHGIHQETVQNILDLAATCNVAIRFVEPAELDAIAHGSSHGGVIAICSARPRTTFEQLTHLLDKLNEPPLLLLLEGVDDARNLGFTMRSAEALGAHALLIKKHLWDFDSVEVARPASGAYERLPLVQLEDVAPLKQLQRRGLQLIGCIANVNRTIYDTNLKQPTILAIGGEKRGLSGAVRDICDLFVTIPTRENASSLSLSHSAAIVMAEAMRQRRALSPLPPGEG